MARAGSSAGQYQPRCRHSGTGSNQYVRDSVDLVHGSPADLTDTFGYAVHPVNVCLPQLTAVSVDREFAAEFDCATGNEVLGLPLPQKPSSSSCIST